MAEIFDIMSLAKTLNLTHIAAGKVDLSKEHLSNLDYLYEVLSAEVSIRYKNKIAELTKSSHLPKKVFDDAGISKGLSWQLDKIRDFDFKSENQNIFIIGKCCTGKTSLAVNIGKAAINQRAVTIYFTFDDFIKALDNRTKMTRLKNSDVIIIDELFYTVPTNEELLKFYKSIMFLMETRSIVLVTNREPSSWSNMGLDEHTIETLLVRLSNNSQQIHL